jgi:hypothetical protein
LVVVAGATVPLFYVKIFKPSAKQVAKRLDRIGLKERMITMAEFQNDTSFLAQKQREDAHLSLHSMDLKRVRFKFPVAMIVSVALAFVIGTTATTLAGLVSAGIIKPGKEVIDDVLPINPANYITVTYVIKSGEGMILDDDVQIVEKGEKCEPVYAVADDGYEFAEWSDGSKSYIRESDVFEEDTVIEVIFAPIGDGDGGDGGDGDPDMQPNGGNKPGRDPNPSEEDGKPQGGANGAYEENNLILDGTEKYREYLEEIVGTDGVNDITRYDEIMKWLETAENIPEELRVFIQTYFDVLV